MGKARRRTKARRAAVAPIPWRDLQVSLPKGSKYHHGAYIGICIGSKVVTKQPLAQRASK